MCRHSSVPLPKSVVVEKANNMINYSSQYLKRIRGDTYSSFSILGHVNKHLNTCQSVITAHSSGSQKNIFGQLSEFENEAKDQHAPNSPVICEEFNCCGDEQFTIIWLNEEGIGFYRDSSCRQFHLPRRVKFFEGWTMKVMMKWGIEHLFSATFALKGNPKSAT